MEEMTLIEEIDYCVDEVEWLYTQLGRGKISLKNRISIAWTRVQQFQLAVQEQTEELNRLLARLQEVSDEYDRLQNQRARDSTADVIG